MGPWLSWESAAFASRRPRVRIPSGPPIKKEPSGSFFIGGDRGAHTFMQATGFSPDLTRKTTLTVFFHTIFPRKTAQRFCGETGERKPLSRGKAPALIKRDGGTRKRFPHHTAPSLAVERGGACWRAFWADLGERRLFHVYHRMGIDSAIRLW